VNRIFQGKEQQFETDPTGKTRTTGVWRGGDAVTPSFAAVVIAQGRQVALSIDAELRGQSLPEPLRLPDLQASRLKLECYQAGPRLQRRLVPVHDRLTSLQGEIEVGHPAAEVFREAERCLSCGNCFGCERCWMYCTPGCMTRVADAAPGHYYAIHAEKCDGCRKCSEECPAGFLDMR
jgi:Pyruvate/2-oxoacid:ferredoxin oxidoreductase delta subunit